MNLILGAVRGMPLATINPFLFSLRRTGFTGKVAFFVSQLDTETMRGLREAGVELLAINEGDVGTHVQVNCLRYFIFRQFMATTPAPIENVMLSDVRDVVFQRDPFDFDMGGQLACFLEDAAMTIGESAPNRLWIEAAYGADMAAALSSRPISCSGTTFGPRDAICSYLDALTGELAALDERDPRIISNVIGMDQGMHNYLLHTGRLAGAQIFENGRGPVLTMGYMRADSVRYDMADLILNEDGRPANVVHQYDRHPDVCRRVLARLSSGPA